MYVYIYIYVYMYCMCIYICIYIYIYIYSSFLLSLEDVTLPLDRFLLDGARHST